MTRPGEYVPEVTEGVSRVEDLPQPFRSRHGVRDRSVLEDRPQGVALLQQLSELGKPCTQFPQLLPLLGAEIVRVCLPQPTCPF